MQPQVYTIKTVSQPPFQCENEEPGHVHTGSLYEVSWGDEDGESYYFIQCYAGLTAWVKTVDRAALLDYI